MTSDSNPRNTNTDLRRFPLGTPQRDGDSWRLTFVRELPYPPERVWKSITDPAETALWWAESRIDPRLGGSFDLHWLNGEENFEWWPGEITAWDPPRLVEHTNSQHGLLRWEIEPTDAGCRLSLTNIVQPPEKRFVSMSLAGWHVHLDHLVEAIEGRAPHWDNWLAFWMPAWSDIHSDYRAEYDLP